jgi:oxygen-independent coproporphyrinogen-3 oxidase
MNEPFALYVHVPWCRHVCPYCDFNVYAAAEPPEREYAAAVVDELAAHARDARWTGRRAGTVYFGGGTPSLLSPQAIEAVLDAVVRSHGLADGAEVSLEANPGTVSRERLAVYRQAGINRLSLGAQSFEARHLRVLGRDHAATDTEDAVAAARAAGFDNVSLDLIFGVPGETVEEWGRDLAAAIALRPEHVSAYALTYEEGTPYHAWRASGRIAPVSDDDEAAMAETTVALLEGAGLARYEISSFARPGREARHNVSYWDGSDYLGVGAGAHSFSRTPPPGRRWMNERLPARYLAAVRAGGRAVAREEELTAAQARGEFVMTGLRRIAGVDAREFARRFGAALDAAFPQVAGLVADGLLERAGGSVRLTTRGLTFADTVAARFL